MPQRGTRRRTSLSRKYSRTRPRTIWKTLTTGELISRWLLMPSAGFEPVRGKHFTLQTTPAGAWDGVIRCQVLEVMPNERLVYSWRSGHEGNVGYGSPLDTVVTWTLSKARGGTRLRLVHSGFVLPKNDTAYTSMKRPLEESRRHRRHDRRRVELNQRDARERRMEP